MSELDYFHGREVTRRQIIEFEKIMERGTKITIPIDHYHSDGIYGRRMYVPSGVILTGKIHKFEQLNILLKGQVDVSVDGKMVTLQAPYVMVSPAGSKRLMRAVTDFEWITILRTDLKDEDVIFDTATCWTEDEYEQHLLNAPPLPLGD